MSGKHDWLTEDDIQTASLFPALQQQLNALCGAERAESARLLRPSGAGLLNQLRRRLKRILAQVRQ